MIQTGCTATLRASGDMDYARRAVWTCLIPEYFSSLRKHCNAVFAKFQKCFVDYKTSPDFQSARD